jgi:hypothetical protein
VEKESGYYYFNNNNVNTVTINGSGFGNIQKDLILYVDNSHQISISVNSWTHNSISFSIPANSAGGQLKMMIEGSYNDSEIIFKPVE